MSIRTPIDTKQLMKDAIAMLISIAVGIGAIIYVLANYLDF
jgi:hypothetical protein